MSTYKIDWTITEIETGRQLEDSKLCSDQENKELIETFFKKFNLKRYRKKPVIVEVVEYDTFETVQKFCGDIAYQPEEELQLGESYTHCFIKTPEGDHKAELGDIIIKGVAGEFYPVKREIFELTYEPVE